MCVCDGMEKTRRKESKGGWWNGLYGRNRNEVEVMVWNEFVLYFTFLSLASSFLPFGF